MVARQTPTISTAAAAANGSLNLNVERLNTDIAYLAVAQLILRQLARVRLWYKPHLILKQYVDAPKRYQQACRGTSPFNDNKAYEPLTTQDSSPAKLEAKVEEIRKCF